MNNEALNKSQIPQRRSSILTRKAAAPWITNLAVEFYQLYHRRTGVPVEETYLTAAVTPNLRYETELTNF